MAQVTFLFQDGQSHFRRKDADRLKPEGWAGIGLCNWKLFIVGISQGNRALKNTVLASVAEV